MPEYLSPGVYIEEFEIGAKPIEGVATSTAAFLGETERGPTRPTLVTSWHNYQRQFGSIFGGEQYLPYAAKGFFDNGGRRCYVTRIIRRDNPVRASRQFGSIEIRAAGEGTWGNRLYIRILGGSTEGFRIRVFYWSEVRDDVPFDPDTASEQPRNPFPQIVEDYDDLVMQRSSINYFEKRIGDFSGAGNSPLIEVRLLDEQNTNPPDQTGDALEPLENGADGDGDLGGDDYGGRTQAGERTGLAALNEPDYDDVSLLYAPNQDAIDGLRQAMITHCENSKYRFAVLDTLANQSNPTTVAQFRDDTPSDYGAVYYPWIRVVDADSGERRLIPPGGHVVGVYARTDIERGVWKAPANEVVRSAVELEYKVPKGAQDGLNPKGVNVIRAFPGRGRRVWGARTLSPDPLWKYVSVRRLFIFLENSIDRGTQWVVFEPNTPQLWARVKQTISQFLRTQWREGALFGRTEEDAFFVTVDETTMSPDDIANGRLIVVVGVAPVRPAEFVIFRIAQLTSSATAAQAQ